VHPITRFALAAHDGPYESWPRRTPLLVDGQLQAATVAGYQLRYQFAVAEGFLLVTDYACPFEEATTFVLLDQRLYELAQHTQAAPYSSWLLDRIEVVDARTLAAVFHDGDRWLLSLTAQSSGPTALRLVRAKRS
jgi:hypothetical protein